MTQRLKQHLVGEHVRRARLERGMTLRMLARQAGFSPSFMSQVEHGLVSPSISSMEKIASAVGLTLGEFFAAVAGGEGGLIVRVADRRALSSRWSDAEIEVLSAPRARLEALLITLRPGGRSGKHPYAHSSEEFAFVVQGETRLTLGPEEHRLRRGDAATVLPGELRLWRNSSRAPATILIVSGAAGVPIRSGGRSARTPATGPSRPGRRSVRGTTGSTGAGGARGRDEARRQGASLVGRDRSWERVARGRARPAGRSEA